MGKNRATGNVMILLGAAALGALGYFLWKGAQPAAAQTQAGTPPPAGGGGGGGGGWEPGRTPEHLLIGQPRVLPVPGWQGWQVPEGLQAFIGTPALTLRPTYGFTRIGIHQPVFTLGGTGFTLI